MLIFAVDDEPAVLDTLREAIAEAVPGAEILDFRRGRDALEAIRERGLHPALVFSDIQMPDMNGLQLATAVKAAAPDARIIFTTAYSEYALEAWKRRIHGYLLKPVTAQDIRETLAELPVSPVPQSEKLCIRCFGHFEVTLRGEPVIFERRQSKELLAFLVDREGVPCTAEEIAAALWEDETDMQAAKARIRKLLSDLRATLQAYGLDDVLIRKRRQLALRRERVDCDYYRLLAGDPEALHAYRGEYMQDYTWAELTAARLYFRNTQETDYAVLP
jgi:Response regulator containing CheY-like receiver and SARP domains